MVPKTETYSGPHDSNSITYDADDYSYTEYTKQKKDKYFVSKALEPTIESVYDVSVDTHHKYHLCTALFSYKEKFEGIGVVIDGYGQGFSEKIYKITSNHIETLVSKGPGVSLGNLWNVLGITYFDYPMFESHGKAGTMMALAGIGKVNPTLLDDFRRLERHNKFIFFKQDFQQDFVYSIDTELVKNMFGNFYGSEKADLCATLQAYTNEHVAQVIEPYVSEGDTIMFSGGVAHNVILIKYLEDKFGITLFTGFAQGDEGISLGKYFYEKYITNGEPYQPISYRNPYSDNSPEYKLPYADIMNDLECYGVTAVYNGAPEIGNRALGHRSFLALPEYPGIKSQLDILKERERFRPYGVMVLEDECDLWFEESIESPYMNKIGTPSASFRAKFPTLVHYDNTVRVQTINKEIYPEMYNLLKYVWVITGDAILVNTSLNINTPMLYKDDEQVVRNMVDIGKINSCYINGEVYAN